MPEAGTCLVVGAGGGMGRELCSRLAERGWRLVLAGRDRSRLEGVAPEATEEVLELDARDFGAVEKAFRAREGLTGAVNLAGSILLKPASATSEEEFVETMDENIRTAFSVARAAEQTMRAGGGSVVLMSSCAARIGLPNHEAISAAKAAVEGLVRAAAATHASAGLRFNAVAPGLVDTPLASGITQNERALKASISMHPAGRIGQPGEVARAIEFLLSPESDWITGQVLGVDGGVSRVKTQ